MRRVISSRLKRSASLGLASALFVLIVCEAPELRAQSPGVPNDPIFHVQMSAPTTPTSEVEAGALFGITLAAGKLGGVIDARDDVVACAIDEDDPPGSPNPNWIDLGSARAFVDGSLQKHPNHPRILPADPKDRKMQFGRLGVAIGDVVGTVESPATNLLFVGNPGRDLDFMTPPCPGPVSIVDAGGVEVFDLTVSALSNPLKLVLTAPANPGECAPLGVDGLGHTIALGDINDDGHRDLVVGAPESEGQGRVYIFFGHANFLSAPYTHWVGLRAPGAFDPTKIGFGCMVAVSDLDADEKLELIVGRNERGTGVGRAYIISGQWISGLATGTLTKPPSTEFQEVENPSPAADAVGDSFGWRVYAVDDVGTGATPGLLDGRPDIAIHAEGADYEPELWYGTSPACTSVNGDVGALFVFFNVNNPTVGHGPPYVDEESLIPIYTPENIGCPQETIKDPVTGVTLQYGGRPGRSAARVYWKTGLYIRDYLLVGEPDRDVTVGGTEYEQAGRVYFIRIPIDKDTARVDALANPFLEPSGVVARSMFGSDIVTLDYLGDPDYPGQQIVVSSRQWRNGAIDSAGRACSFTSLPPP